MLVVTRQADYALRASVEVAQITYGERISTATIGEHANIPLPFLAKIVSQLVTKGILKTFRGLGGGVSLQRRAKDITMLEIIEAIDGPVALNTCVFDPSTCENTSTCSICEVFVDAQHKLVAQLGAVSLEALAARAQERVAQQSLSPMTSVVAAR
jgi:Rrf2 family protein